MKAYPFILLNELRVLSLRDQWKRNELFLALKQKQGIKYTKYTNVKGGFL